MYLDLELIHMQIQLLSFSLLTIAVMEETGGDGIGRLFEATGAESLINNCFSLLR